MLGFSDTIFDISNMCAACCRVESWLPPALRLGSPPAARSNHRSVLTSRFCCYDLAAVGVGEERALFRSAGGKALRLSFGGARAVNFLGVSSSVRVSLYGNPSPYVLGAEINWFPPSHIYATTTPRSKPSSAP